MSIRSISTLAAATAAILGGLVIEASAGPGCGTGGGVRYSSAQRAVSVAHKPIATKAAPAPRQTVALANPQSAKPLKLAGSLAGSPADAGSGGSEAVSEKVVRQAPAPIRQAAAAKAPVDEAPAQQTSQQTSEGIDNVETSVSAIAARLAALSGRRSAAPVE